MGKQIGTNLRCNEQIRITPIRLIGAENEQLGVIETRDALARARDLGMDLVEVSPHDRPPVCKIMDYGKFKYNQKRHQRKHHEQQLKELRLRPKTDQHDLDVRIDQCIKFLREGDKVQFTLVFKGRERSHPEVAFATFKEILGRLGDMVKIERPPGMDGRAMIMIVSPNKPGLDKHQVSGEAKPKTESKAASAARPATSTAAVGTVSPTPAPAADNAPVDLASATEAAPPNA